MSFLAALNSDADVAEGFQYPIRPSQPDCSFYLRTGGCKFGSHCRFNHPRENRADQDKNQISTEELQIVKEKDKGISKALDQCKFHLMPVGCRFGETCRYIHSNEKTETVPVELNALGLPIRKGQKLCSYYVRTGVCKYSSTCKFHHPEPSGVAGLHVSRNHSAGALQSTIWPLRLPVTSQALMTSNGSGSKLDILLPCLPAMSLEWLNLYTDQIRCQDNNAPSVSKRTNHSSTIEQNGIFKLADISIQQKEVIDNCKEFGESHSLNGIKYEGFKLALACLPNHSMDHLSDSEPCLLSPIGLPQRPRTTVSSPRFWLLKIWLLYAPLESDACSMDQPLQSGSSACCGIR